MRVPQISQFGLFGIQNNYSQKTAPKNFSKLNDPIGDTVSFGSTAKYMKKYSTLPDEIKKVLDPKDAIDMFKDMERTAKGISTGRKLMGGGKTSAVYYNPWLKDYYLLVTDDNSKDIQLIYSRHTLGNSIWIDSDNHNIQLIERLA